MTHALKYIQTREDQLFNWYNDMLKHQLFIKFC